MPYFDHNATSPLTPAAREAWTRAQDELWQNPSSPTRAAARVRNALEDARAKLAALIGARPEQIVFNSGATEGAASVIAHLARNAPPGSRLALNTTEHACVLEAAARFFPGRIDRLPLWDAGAEHRVPDGTAAVALMTANNETGVIYSSRKISNARAPFIRDITQSLGKLPSASLGATDDWLIASAHKFGGPKGVGFVKITSQSESFQAQPGGAQEHGHRGGTENYPAIAAMLAALEEAELRKVHLAGERLVWRAEFEHAITQRIPGVQIVAEKSERLWSTVMLIMPREENTRWVAHLDKRGFQVSTGSACATGQAGPSHVLSAMGVPANSARHAVRVSSGWETTREDWLALGAAFQDAAQSM